MTSGEVTLNGSPYPSQDLPSFLSYQPWWVQLRSSLNDDTRTCSYHILTKQLTFFQPRNTSIDEFWVGQTRQSTDFEVRKLWKFGRDAHTTCLDNIVNTLDGAIACTYTQTDRQTHLVCRCAETARLNINSTTTSPSYRCVRIPDRTFHNFRGLHQVDQLCSSKTSIRHFSRPENVKCSVGYGAEELGAIKGKYRSPFFLSPRRSCMYSLLASTEVVYSQPAAIEAAAA